VKPTVSRSLPPQAGAVRCFVAGHATCRIPVQQIAGLRSCSPSLRGQALPASFLKHADEQTIAGICALSQVLQLPALTNVDFTQWGVIAAPRFLGRAAMAVSLVRFAAEGAWGISPHLVPHRSLHALSGTVSQALRIQGPNLGVGGGSDSAAEGLLAAGALFADQDLPGIWVVLTAFDPELVPADPTAPDTVAPATECVAIALALVPVQGQTHGFFLSVGAHGADQGARTWATFSFEGMAATLGSGGEGCWQLPCGGWTAWRKGAAAGENCS
jgi:hypothetical protein